MGQEARKILPGSTYSHREGGRTPHIVLYLGLFTEDDVAGEHLVVHRPVDKHHTVYCEPIASFEKRFVPAE